jgi:hypothetical protein
MRQTAATPGDSTNFQRREPTCEHRRGARPRPRWGRNRSLTDSKRSVTAGMPRRCATATDVSRRTSPIAGIDLFAAFLDCFFYQVRVLGTPASGGLAENGLPISPARFTEPVDVGSHFLQPGSWQGLQIRNDDFQRAHDNRLSSVDAPDKPHPRNGTVVLLRGQKRQMR